MIGMRAGRLVILRAELHQGKRAWLCKCDCGNEKIILAGNFGKSTLSCGCLRKENCRNGKVSCRTHGMHGTIEYRTWVALRQRCRDTNYHGYRLYGGRGITVCERWNDFANFLADMGWRPGPLYSIDRIDVNGNYEPSNCRWLLNKEQAKNRRPRHQWDVGMRGSTYPGYVGGKRAVALLSFGV